MTMQHTPPTPLMKGSTTPVAKPAATAASTALPPAFKISTPAAVASGCMAATMPRSPTASRLLTNQAVSCTTIPAPPYAKLLGHCTPVAGRCAADFGDRCFYNDVGNVTEL